MQAQEPASSPRGSASGASPRRGRSSLTAPELPQTEAGRHREQRPAQPDEQPVAAGHVGRGVLRERGVVPGGVGEVEVDRVLGQHCDQGEDRDGETTRDVELGHLGRPGEEHGRTHHRGAVDKGCIGRGQFDAGQAQKESRQRNDEERWRV